MISLWHIPNIAIGVAPNTTATTISVCLLISYFVKKVIFKPKEKE